MLAITLTALVAQFPDPIHLLPPIPESGIRAIARRQVQGRPADDIVIGSYSGTMLIRHDPVRGRANVTLLDNTTSPPFTLHTLDIDADGNEDILLGDRILFDDAPPNSSTVAFESVDLLGFTLSKNVLDQVVDVDGNGLADVLLIQPGVPAPLHALHALGPRSFSGPTSLPTSMVVAAEAFDLEGDGDLDLAVVTAGDRVELWRNDGGPLPWPVAFEFDAGDGPGEIDLVVRDLDGDGAPDVILSRSEVRVHLGGAGGYALTASYPTANVTEGMTLVDVDADGDEDILAHRRLGASPGTQVRWLERTGPTTFAQTSTIAPTPESPYEVTVADMRGTGEVEVVGISLSSTGVRSLSLPLSTAMNPSEKLHTGIRGVSTVAAGDLDGDGDEDLVAMSPRGLHISERVSKSELRPVREIDLGVVLDFVRTVRVIDATEESPAGAVVFADVVGRILAYVDPLGAGEPVRLVLGSDYANFEQQLDVWDVDLDGDEDIVVLRRDKSGIDVIEQVGPLEFSRPAPFVEAHVGTTLRRFRLGDLDGDLDVDVVTLESDANGQSVRTHLASPGGLTSSSSALAVETANALLRIETIGSSVTAEVLVLDTQTATQPPSWRVDGYRAEPSGALVHTNQYANIDAPAVAVDFEVVSRRASPVNASVIHVWFAPGGSNDLSLVSFDSTGAITDSPAESADGVYQFEALDLDGDGERDIVGFGSTLSGIWLQRGQTNFDFLLGTSAPFCTAQTLNSSGWSARLDIKSKRDVGSVATLACLRLDAFDVPPGQPMLFLVSRNPGFVPGAGGALGTLCLGGTIGRFVAPEQIRMASA